MKRYPEYKESEVGWIGKIPSYWQTATIKHLTKNLDGKRIPLSGEVRADQKRIYPYYGANGVIDYVEGYIFEGEHILIGEDGAPFFDKIREVSLLASGKFWVNNHCHILKNIDTSESRFIVHCLNSVDYFEYITGSTRDKLTQADLNRIKIPLPSYQEQTQIANFLDRKTGQIDELIRIKERRIELLHEQRTALINQAVTKGLDPNVEMKPSGVEWIGDICEHWEIKKLKHIVQGGLTNGLFKKKDQFGSGVKLINVTDMYQDDFLVKFEELGRVEAKPHEIETYAVEPGDIFFVRSSLKLEGVAASACITDVPEPTVFECHLVRLQPCLKWTHCRCQNNGKISKIIESHRHNFSRNRPQPALHNRDSGEVVGHYRNGYNELIHRKELVPWGTVSDKHLHT